MAGRLLCVDKDCVSFEMTPESLEKLVSWKMPFGKHAGVVLADLPGPVRGNNHNFAHDNY